MRKDSGIAPSPWMQLLLAILAIMPWWVLLNNSLALKSAQYPLAYSIHYQDR